MKKFICTIPIQDPNNLHKNKYENPMGIPLLDSSIETRFPIIPIIESFVENDETVTVVMLKIKPHNNTKVNCKTFLEELEEIEKEKNCKIKKEIIEIHFSECVEDHLFSFEQLINNIEDDDELYVDITYGTKPLPLVYLMAVTCGYKYRKDVSVEYIIYGSFNYNDKTSNLYDVTSLFFMNQTVNSLDGIKEPFAAIKSVLYLNDDTEKSSREIASDKKN